MSRESREAIENGYEVTIKRHHFLGATRRQRLIEYLTKNYFENKCLAYAENKFRDVKHSYQAWEDTKKETTIDTGLESIYIMQKVAFLRIVELVRALANVLD